MSLSDNLKEARQRKKITQEELANILGKSKNVISNWERGDNKPDADTLFALCDILDVDANFLIGWSENKEFALSIKEQDHIKKYRTLDKYGKKQIDAVMQNEYERVMETEHTQEDRVISLLYPKTEYLTGLSAGSGNYVFDDIPTGVINVPEEFKDADFVIGVTGNSMEPTYSDGDKVAIKKCSSIHIGEIGAFMIDGNGYIKELGYNKLISHNKGYEDIAFDESIVCVGKVLGKL